MLKKLFVYFLIFNCFNVSIGQIETPDIYLSGNETVREEINSLVELIEEVATELPDSSPEDEDDDIPDSYQVKEDDSFDFEFYIFSNILELFSFSIGECVEKVVLLSSLKVNLPKPGYYLFLFRYTPF